MKIGFTGIDLPEGKVKYNDQILIALAEKDNPKKVTPYFMELIPDEFAKTDAILVQKGHLLDVLIYDLEKFESRLERSEEDAEKVLAQKCIEILEGETPLCDVDFNEEELKQLKTISPFSLKPVLEVDDSEDLHDIFAKVLDYSDKMFFYTSRPTESHAWLIEKNSDIVTCAEKIHTDLARGFIRGDVVSFDEYMECHNFNDCKSKGKVRVVERDYIVQPNEVIEIRFNV